MHYMDLCWGCICIHLMGCIVHSICTFLYSLYEHLYASLLWFHSLLLGSVYIFNYGSHKISAGSVANSFAPKKDTDDSFVQCFVRCLAREARTHPRRQEYHRLYLDIDVLVRCWTCAFAIVLLFKCMFWHHHMSPAVCSLPGKPGIWRPTSHIWTRPPEQHTSQVLAGGWQTKQCARGQASVVLLTWHIYIWYIVLSWLYAPGVHMLFLTLQIFQYTMTVCISYTVCMHWIW